MFCDGNEREVLKFALRSGLLSKIKTDDGLVAYKLLDDPNLVHIRTKAELEWSAQQRNDTRDTRLSVPIRKRDGDACRYCAVIVHWTGRTSSRKGTLDHLRPGEPGTVETMVVACLACNSEQRDAEGAEREQLNPPPRAPFYSEYTARWLSKNGHPTLPTPRPGDQPDHAPETTTTQPVQRPGNQPDHAHTADSDPAQPGHRAADPESWPRGNSPPNPALPTNTQVDKTSSAGSGRDGSGNATALSPRSSTPPHAARRPKRSPRGRNIQESSQ
jgi:hypothetical protein